MPADEVGAMQQLYNASGNQLSDINNSFESWWSKNAEEFQAKYGAINDVYGGFLGYTGHDVGEEYIVTITSNSPSLYNSQSAPVRAAGDPNARREVRIRTLLQESFDMSTESEWQPMTAATMVGRITKTLFALAGRAPVNRWITRRIWQGTSPLEFTLNLRFEAESNPQREVLLPAEELHRMCLPYVGNNVKGSWFLSPPGPSPLQFWAPEKVGRGEIITITVGKFLRIHRCVVKGVKVSFAPKFQVGGMPMSANVSINFQTFEIQTKESLDTEVYTALGPEPVGYVYQGEY